LTSRSIDVAVVGADDALGEAVLELLAERRFPHGRVHALGAGRAPEASVDFQGEPLDLESVHEFDFSAVGLALFCASDSVAAVHASRAAQAGARVIDASPRFRLDLSVPLLLPMVNAGAGGWDAALCAVPGPATTPLALALSPLDAAFGVDWLGAVALYPVSASGNAGVRELADQTQALFNQQPVSPELYSKRIAFNVLARIGAGGEGGSSGEEAAIARELARILGSPGLQVSATCLQAPTFYGMGIAVTMLARDPMAREEVRECLAAAPGLRLMDDPSDGDDPAPATDAVSQDEVLVGRLRVGEGDARRLDLWLASDNLRLGQALPMVQLAELLVEKYPS
jgi:aspartate-semialdehyde dehydrogenase